MTIANGYPDFNTLTDVEKDEVLEYLKTELYREYNETKNALKHKGRKEKSVSYNNFKADAEKHISGAIMNFCDYKKTMPVDFPLMMQYCSERGINFH